MNSTVQTVYIDVLFISNLIINLILLYGSGFVSNRKMSLFRMICGAGIGAVYLSVMFFSTFTILESYAFKFIISLFMIFISFSFKECKEFIKLLGIYYILNFMLAGGIYFANSMFNICYLTNGSFYFKTTLFTMLLGLGAVVLFGGGFFYIVKSNILKKSSSKEILLYYNGNVIKLDAFLDTGNALIDPLSRTAVVVVSKEKLKNIIDYDHITNTRNFRIIPCKTVAEADNLLYGFKPDKLLYDNKELNVTIAISDINYDAIINPLTLV